jgi:hypothetical protein
VSEPASEASQQPVPDQAIEVPWEILPFAEAMPRIADAEDFVRNYGRAVHLHDLIMRLEAVNPNEARRLLMQNLVSIDGHVVQAWTADLKPGALLQIRQQTYRIGPMGAS